MRTSDEAPAVGEITTLLAVRRVLEGAKGDWPERTHSIERRIVMWLCSYVPGGLLREAAEQVEKCRPGEEADGEGG